MAPLTVDDVRGALERLGLNVRRVGGYYQAQCPAHPDQHPSLIFGEGRDEGCFLACMAGCAGKDVARALGTHGTAVPLSAEELERRRAEEEADRDARTARARARYELALVHPDRLPAIEWFSSALKWDVVDLLERRGVGWDGERVVFPIAGADGVLTGIERYAPPGSRARQSGPKLIAHGVRGLWPAPATVDGLRYLVEGSPAAATALAFGLPTVAYPSASGLRRVDAERLRAAGGNDLILLADADEPGRRAARVSVLVLRDVGLDGRAIDLFDGADTGVDVADELRAREDGVDWLLAELAEFTTTKKEVHR